MIHVVVELWPGGEQAKKRVLATMAIANVSELAEVSNYRYSVDETFLSKPATSGSGEIANHHRSHGALRLVQRVLRDWFNRTGRS
jgi:hypothetical protein